MIAGKLESPERKRPATKATDSVALKTMMSQAENPPRARKDRQCEKVDAIEAIGSMLVCVCFGKTLRTLVWLTLADKRCLVSFAGSVGPF